MSVSVGEKPSLALSSRPPAPPCSAVSKSRLNSPILDALALFASREHVRFLATPPGAMFIAVIHYVRNLSEFWRVMPGVPVYPPTGKTSDYWKGFSVWEGSTVQDHQELMDLLEGDYSKSECFELTELGARHFETYQTRCRPKH
jgi:hypothetical protein